MLRSPRLLITFRCTFTSRAGHFEFTSHFFVCALHLAAISYAFQHKCADILKAFHKTVIKANYYYRDCIPDIDSPWFSLRYLTDRLFSMV